MRKEIRLLAAAGTLLALTAAGPAAVAARDEPLAPRVVTTFPGGYVYGSFAESLAVGPQGEMYATVTIWTDREWNVGQVWRIEPDGRMRQLGADLQVGILTGLALDRDGSLFVGLVTFDIAGVRSGVLRFDTTGTATRAVTLPAGTFPNGLALDDGHLYVSDSFNGAVWRAERGVVGNQRLTHPWLRDATLSVASADGWEGVNGIAFWGTTLYAVNADTGCVVKVPLSRNGRPGDPSVAGGDPALVGADGIAFDAQGSLWIAVNHGDLPVGGALARMDASGSVRVMASDPGWLDYPSQPAFDTRTGHLTSLYILNGSLNTGNPNLIALRVGVAGQPLP